MSAARPIRRGDLYWAAIDDGHASLPLVEHPHVVVQDDVLNASRIETVVVMALTSNLNRAKEPGNVLLEPGEGQLAKQSVIVVSQVSSVPKKQLGDLIGQLDEDRVEEALRGLAFLQRF